MLLISNINSGRREVMPALNDSCPEPREGWGPALIPGDSEVHYYRGLPGDTRTGIELSTFPICGRGRGFYHALLEPDEMPMPDDCPACRKVLDREAMDQGFPDPETEALMEEDSRAERGL
jgi:hypothetical protein